MNTFLSILLILFCNISYGEESIKPRFNLVRSFDPCEDDKRITFFISVEDIKKEDSLYGFNLGLKYDTTKVLYNNYLTASTVMSKFSHKFANNDKDNQVVRIDGGVLGSNPLSGDTSLVGFEFIYIADDFSSVTFSLDFLQMTDEYTREIDISESYIEFSPTVKDLENRKISLNSSLKDIIIDSTLTKKLFLDTDIYSDNRMDNFDFKLTYDKNLISLALVENENYTLEKIDDKLLYDVYRLNSKNIVSKNEFIEINIIQNAELNLETNSKIEVEIVDWDKKSCITRIGNKYEVNYQTYKSKEMNSIRDYIQSSKITKFQIYNILGTKVYESKIGIETIPQLDRGLYIIKSELKTEKIIIN